MGKLIRLPIKRKSNPFQNSYDSSEHQLEALEQKPAHTYVISPKEDEAFMDLLREWPCFEGFDASLSLYEVFGQYYDDELSLAQDCALEFMFHMHDPESTFDIGHALYTWDEEDREFFILSIGMHAEIIDKIKKEEL